jgi:cytochrome b involved in lipid metabolism
MNKTIGLVIMVVVLAGTWWVLSRSTGEDVLTPTPSPTVQASQSVEPTPSMSPSPSVSGSSSPVPTVSGITMAVVAQHSTATSCYTVIRGSVYDLTSWIAKHPGGRDAILSICGKDGSALFVDQHGGSTRQESQLATFKIGVLAQ